MAITEQERRVLLVDLRSLIWHWSVSLRRGQIIQFIRARMPEVGNDEAHAAFVAWHEEGFIHQDPEANAPGWWTLTNTGIDHATNTEVELERDETARALLLKDEEAFYHAHVEGA